MYYQGNKKYVYMKVHMGTCTWARANNFASNTIICNILKNIKTNPEVFLLENNLPEDSLNIYKLIYKKKKERKLTVSLKFVRFHRLFCMDE